MWTVNNTHVAPVEIGFVVAILFAVVIGLANGWFVTYLKIPSFLVTLGMLLVVRGTALYVTDGFPQRTWTAESPLMKILVGEITTAHLRTSPSPLWSISFAIIPDYVLPSSPP